MSLTARSFAPKSVYESMIGNVVVSKEDAFDYASYVCATGKDYFSDEKTMESENDREMFKKEFPEYASLSYAGLNRLSDKQKEEIEDWYFSGSWVSRIPGEDY